MTLADSRPQNSSVTIPTNSHGSISPVAVLLLFVPPAGMCSESVSLVGVVWMLAAWVVDDAIGSDVVVEVLDTVAFFSIGSAAKNNGNIEVIV